MALIVLYCPFAGFIRDFVINKSIQ